jgi:S-DNA-T family DNA segregation ATPase FtsK/SpoIIIE
VSNRPRLTAQRSLELLEELQRVVADFARREAQLTKDYTSKRYHLQRGHQDALQRADAQFTARLGAAEAITKGEEDRVRHLHNQRRAVIQRIHHANLGDVQLNARRAREKFLSDVQVKHLNAKRQLPHDLEAADQTYAEFSSKLKAERSNYVRVEQNAIHAFSGYPALRRLVHREAHAVPEPISSSEVLPQSYQAEVALKELQGQLGRITGAVKEFRGIALPALFRNIPLPGFIIVLAAACAILAFVLRATTGGLAIAGCLGVALIGIVIALYRIGLKQAHAPASEIAAELDTAVRLHDECRAAATAKHVENRRVVQENYDRIKAELDSMWKNSDQIESDFTRNAEEKFERQIPKALSTADRLLAARMERVTSQGNARRELQNQENSSNREKLVTNQERETQDLLAEEAANWTSLTNDWNREITPIYASIEEMQSRLAETSPALDAAFTEQWKPADHFTPATRLGNFEIDLTEIAPKDQRLALPGPAKVNIPVAVAFPEQGSLLFETQDSGSAPVIGTLNLLILRLLATMPPGKASFTILDPVGLGQNFAGLMHLSDYEENLINRRIWTQRDHIEERLTELNEHIEKVIQMYLRNEFATISEYNAQAGSVAEKYHFLVIADFPANFGEGAAKRLQSIISSGPRCGVFTLMHWDQRQPAPDALVPDDLRKNSVHLKSAGGTFVVGPAQTSTGARLVLDPAPDATVAADLVHKIGPASIDSNRVEVPFSQITPEPAARWTSDTAHELRIPIGRTGATKLQYLAIGKGTRQHALFAGKTGSGKSTLFHVIITNLALACSPEQVEFYLIDFKKGVEFKCYATKKLPHARVIAIESDREFGLSVLQRVDDELKRRGDLFRKLGVQDVAGYKKAGGTEPMPRSLLMIDEFQEFFVEDDVVAQNASMLFDRIVRQGRAFGIHVLLGSQTLGGAYTLARATLGQMVIRVALQCNEADAYLIMDEGNPAPRLLSRPGEGIYNDAAGAIEGNSPFQVVWLPDDERDRWLDEVGALAAARGTQMGHPIVFEGNAPADILENDRLEQVLGNVPTATPVTARAWLGAPNSIKGPTEVMFHRQSGNHLLIAGQRDETALTMLGISMLALAGQYPIGRAKFYLFHATIPGSTEAAFVEQIAAAVPHGLTLVAGHQVPDVMNELSADLKARIAGETPDAPEVFVLIHGLPRFKKLRFEDDFSFGSGEANPGAQLNDLFSEGSSYGIHLLITVDTFANVSRYLSRKALGEFEMRVVFQMSANDSASLIDSPKASTLGMHRAIFYSENLGQMETFRPYATPDAAWIQQAGEKLRGQKA